MHVPCYVSQSYGLCVSMSGNTSVHTHRLTLQSPLVSHRQEGRLFSVRVGKNPASRVFQGQTGKGPFTFNEITVTSSMTPDLQVCVNPELGEMCSSRAAAPDEVKCFASSANSIAVKWGAAPSQGESGLLSGYRITAFALGEQAVATVNGTAETRVTFSTDAVESNLRVKFNLVYTVQVEALYDEDAVQSKTVTCHVPQDGLPCMPPPSIAADALGSKGESRDCPCLTNQQAFYRLIPDTKNGVLQVKHIPQPLYPIDRDHGTYGSGKCAAHDVSLPPSCAGDDAPTWCSSAWCWVDSAKCTLAHTKSSYFEASNIAYSYETCGEQDTYSSVCGCKYVQYRCCCCCCCCCYHWYLCSCCHHSLTPSYSPFVLYHDTASEPPSSTRKVCPRH